MSGRKERKQGHSIHSDGGGADSGSTFTGRQASRMVTFELRLERRQGSGLALFWRQTLQALGIVKGGRLTAE